jgi:hypothetical protein
MKLRTRSLVCLSLTIAALPAARAATVIGKTWFPSMEGITASEEDGKTIDPIGTVGFYTDADNANSVYYIPPFVPVEGIAATLTTNTAQIGRADEVRGLRKDLFKDQLDAYKQIQNQVNQTRITYNIISEKLASLPEDQQFLRSQMQAIMLNLKNEMELLERKLANLDSTVPASLRQIYAEQFQFVLGSANVAVDGLDLTKAADQGKAAGKLNGSYGGLLSVNMVAGLTAEQYAAIRKYKELRAAAGQSTVTFAMLPVQSIGWKKLTETATDDLGGVPIFRSVNGGGNLQGATATIDLTVDGASSLGLSPPPFILPVATSAKVLQTLPPFTAKLDCVIKSSWFYNGRTDVRDGLIIYNNDITQNIVSDAYGTTGSAESPCKLSYEGGGDPGQAVREAAIRASLDQIMNTLQNLGIERSNLAYAERQRFADAVQADIAANRHKGSNKGWSRAIGGYLTGGWAGLAVGVFSQSSNFYWHTDKRNVSMTDSIEFHTQIVERGNSQVTIDLPMQVCVAWQPELRSYVRCAADQLPRAGSLTEAAGIAKKSPECQNTDTTEACGEARNTEAPKNPSNGTIDLPATI